MSYWKHYEAYLLCSGPSGPGGTGLERAYTPYQWRVKMSKIDELYTQMCVIDNDVLLNIIGNFEF